MDTSHETYDPSQWVDIPLDISTPIDYQSLLSQYRDLSLIESNTHDSETHQTQTDETLSSTESSDESDESDTISVTLSEMTESISQREHTTHKTDTTSDDVEQLLKTKRQKLEAQHRKKLMQHVLFQSSDDQKPSSSPPPSNKNHNEEKDKRIAFKSRGKYCSALKPIHYVPLSSLNMSTHQYKVLTYRSLREDRKPQKLFVKGTTFLGHVERVLSNTMCQVTLYCSEFEDSNHIPPLISMRVKLAHYFPHNKGYAEKSQDNKNQKHSDARRHFNHLVGDKTVILVYANDCSSNASTTTSKNNNNNTKLSFGHGGNVNKIMVEMYTVDTDQSLHRPNNATNIKNSHKQYQNDINVDSDTISIPKIQHVPETRHVTLEEYKHFMTRSNRDQYFTYVNAWMLQQHSDA